MRASGVTAGIAGSIVAVVAAVTFVAHAAQDAGKAGARAEIPLPVLAPWHRRPAALGKGPAQSPVAPSTSPPVPEPDPNVWPQEDVNEGLKACVAKVAAIQARLEIAEPFRKGPCGAPAAVELKRVGSRHPLKLSPPAVLRCSMAVALYRFVEESLQPAAVDLLGSPVASLEGISTYSCRNRNGDTNARLSEHALANALDVGTFRLADGRTIKVLSDWGPTVRDLKAPQAEETAALRQESPAAAKVIVPAASKRVTANEKGRNLRLTARNRPTPPIPIKKSTALGGSSDSSPEPAKHLMPSPPTNKSTRLAKKTVKPRPPTKEMLFLKRVHKEACRYFGTVLGPEANEAHRNHFHFDLAPRKHSNYCR
jgi:hypothetical protein